MTSATGSRLITAPADRIHALLLQPRRLPDWNPAFLSLTGPEEALLDQDYQLRTLPDLRGTFRYTEISPHRIRMEWTVPGMHENCEWILHDKGATTEVVHSVQRTGPLAAVLRHTLDTLPTLRLDRLTDTAAGQ
ncbi:SRPBCC family protein [Streptomyces sp. NBC_01198]|uniref:SRPBCC family protein n=1 Tax=Streptomyces sp. NBC_01198 TaxID=2903769 RepID=UPI002E163E90|nr:SRPBCC family protein [Streptomyces sp. NBC_01198]